MGAVVVADRNKRMGRPKGPDPRRKTIASYKASEEYAAWFDSLLQHFRDESGFSTLPASGLIEMALAAIAQREGFKEPPPKR